MKYDLYNVISNFLGIKFCSETFNENNGLSIFPNSIHRLQLL